MSPAPQTESFGGDLIEEATARLQEALSVLEVIFEDDLLAELPAKRAARDRHQRAVSLLTMMQRDLVELAVRLEAGSVAISLVARTTKGAGQD